VTDKRDLFWFTIAVCFLVFLFLIRSILLPFVLGIFIAYFLSPVTDKLEKLGLARALATLLVIGCFFLSFILLSLLIFPAIVTQISGLISELPGYMARLEQEHAQNLTEWLGGFPAIDTESLKENIAGLSGVVVKLAGNFLTGLLQSSMAFVNVISMILITPVVAFYLLNDWNSIIRNADELLPRTHAATIRTQLRIIDRTLAGFLRGQLNVCLILSTYYALLLSLFGLKFGIIIGIATGLLVIVPYVGWLVGTLIGLTIAFFQFDDAGQMGIILTIFVVGMVVEGNFLTPKLVGEKVGLHPVWIIFGMLSGAALFGFVGVLLAVPASAVIGVLLRFAIERYRLGIHYQGEAPVLKP
jgi:predicted PurR-regulated permease PerM